MKMKSHCFLVRDDGGPAGALRGPGRDRQRFPQSQGVSKNGRSGAEGEEARLRTGRELAKSGRLASSARFGGGVMTLMIDD